MRFFNLLIILTFLASCSMQKDEVPTESSVNAQTMAPKIVLESLNLENNTDRKFDTSNTPEIKFFHMAACFRRTLPERRIMFEDWDISGVGQASSDIRGCVRWVEEVKMDYSLSQGTFLRERTFTRLSTGETLKVNMHIDQYQNKIFRGVGHEASETGTSSSTEGLVEQESLLSGNTLASDPIREAGDIQVLSNQDGHIPFVKYRIALQIPNRISSIYERLQGEPIQVRLERVDDMRKVYIPVKEREGYEIRSAPYGSTNVAFDLEYNRYSPMRWIPYKLHIKPLNPAFKNKGLTVNLCLKPWEGQKYSVYDATTFGSCPEPHDKSLKTKNPEIYFNHVSFKQLGQEDHGYKMDDYLDISLRKRWRITVRPFVNYWHNFESNNHYFPLLSGNFKIKMILLAYNKGDTLELTQEDIKNKNFDVIGYTETKARINKGNLIGDLSLDFPFQKWYRVYTRTFAAIQVLPLDEEENPYLKSGMALIPFHAADRDYSIYVKTDQFTEILDSNVNSTKVNEANIVDKAADMGMGSAQTITQVESDTSKVNTQPLTSTESEKSKGRVVFENIENRKFFLDEAYTAAIKDKLQSYFSDERVMESIEVGSTERYKLSPEKTAIEIMNSNPMYLPLERYFVDTKKDREEIYSFFSTFLDEVVEYTPIYGTAGMMIPPMPTASYKESRFDKIDYAKWAEEGLDANAKRIFCRYFIRSTGAHRLKLEDGSYSRGRKSLFYEKCLENPDTFIHVDNVSYVQKVNDYKFTMGMEIRQGLDRRVYLFNSYNDRESMSGRINFALGFEKTNLGGVAAGAMGTMKALSASPVGRAAKWTLGLFNANFGGYDVGRYWGLDHSVGLSENISRSEAVSLTGTKHDVVFNADVRKCAIVRFKLPEEISTSFTYYDRADFVSFSNMMSHQLGTMSLWLGIDMGSRKTPLEQFHEMAYSLSDTEKKFLETAMRRFEFCNKKVTQNEDMSESWYYLGSDLGYHSGTLDPLSIRHNPFMKLVRGTKNFDEVIDHLSHAIEAIFIEEAKNYEAKQNVGEVIKKIYKTPKEGYPPSMGKELVSMIGLPGMLRRKTPTDNPYYAQVLRREEVYGKKGKVILNEDGSLEKVEKPEKKGGWFWD